MHEEWEKVSGFERYEISSFGRVRSNVNQETPQMILRQHLAGKGYCFVVMYKAGGKKSCQYVHRMVANAFLANEDKTLHVNHIDLNKTNNIATNLEWVTRKGNAQHALIHGRYEMQHIGGMTLARNNKNMAKKLTTHQVDEIKEMCLAGIKHPDIALMYGVTPSTISKIKRGAIWSDTPKINRIILNAARNQDPA